MAAPESTSFDGDLLLTDFSSNSTDLRWTVVNDNVMGGRSEGGFEVNDGRLRFTGRINTNGGGFSSIRSAPFERDLSAYGGIRLRVKGDGRRYTCRLTSDASYRGRPLGFWREFDTMDGEWHEVLIPFDEFQPRFRGTALDGPTFDPAKVTSVGLMLADRRDGDFVLELDRVSFYAPQSFELESLRWKKRILVLSARTRLELENALADWAATRTASLERDMVLITLVDDGVATAGDRALSRKDIEALRGALDLPAGSFALALVGKDGAVKLKKREPVAMESIHALIDSMPMRQREMSERR